MIGITRMKAEVDYYPVEHQNHYWREYDKIMAMADELRETAPSQSH